MKTLTLALTLITMPALAQEPFFLSTVPFRHGPLPMTMQLDDGKGNIIGTGTFSPDPAGTKMVIRLKDGTLLGTLVIGRDHKQTFYDVNGRTRTAPITATLPTEEHPMDPAVREALDQVTPDKTDDKKDKRE